jgi:hypothetical protein
LTLTTLLLLLLAAEGVVRPLCDEGGGGVPEAESWGEF